MRLRFSIVICTLNRETVLCETLKKVFSLMVDRTDGEIILVDQTRKHTAETERFLSSASDSIRWFAVNFASLTRARNLGVSAANGEIVIFLDDDVDPSPALIDEHLESYTGPEIWGVGGSMLLPQQTQHSQSEFTTNELSDISINRINRYDLDWPRFLEWAPGCNMSFRRNRIHAVGGFDEAFQGASIGEETEFCFRIRKAGGKIKYAPKAKLIHLINPTGGCRDAAKEKERLAQVLESLNYALTRMQTSRAARWQKLLAQSRVFSINRQSFRQFTWPFRIWWCVSGLLRAIQAGRRNPILPLLPLSD